MVHLVAKAAIVPNAASHGATMAPTTPTVAGISRRGLPFSSFIMILVMFPSWISSLILLTKLSAEIENSSFTTFLTAAPQLGQNLASSSNSAPHFAQCINFLLSHSVRESFEVCSGF